MYTGENGSDPRDEIVRLEAHIDELAAKIENCRKFILAARVATWGGGVVLVAMLVGAIRLDPATMAGASAALLGGIVVWGSNNSTAKEARKEVVGGRSTSGRTRSKRSTCVRYPDRGAAARAGGLTGLGRKCATSGNAV